MSRDRIRTKTPAAQGVQPAAAAPDPAGQTAGLEAVCLGAGQDPAQGGIRPVSRNRGRPKGSNGGGWSADQTAHLMQHYADMPIHDLVQALGKQKEQIYRKARMLGLRRAASFSAATHFNTGKRHSPGTEFKPGQKPWNTGLKGWKAGGRSAETRFKKGERHGAAVHNYVPIGTLRISKDGYLEQKITDDPVPYPNKRWMAVHRLVWIKHHGPIPPKHIVAFKPGMRTADLALITIDRLQLMSMAENIRRNHWQATLPPEVASLVQLKGAIRRQVNRITKASEERTHKS